MTFFCSFGLREDILANLSKLGFENSTKIQALAIPEILDGRDVIACAQTGTGKTAAFFATNTTKNYWRKTRI